VRSRAAAFCLLMSLCAAAYLAFATKEGLRGETLGDLRLYRGWAAGAMHGHWPVVNFRWQYPVAAIVPMLVAYLITTGTNYPMVFVALAVAGHLAVGTLLWRRGHRTAGWWLLGFLVAVGPVAVARVDGFATDLVLAAYTVGGAAVAGALCTVGAWVKVWPAAPLAALATAARRRDLLRLVTGAAAACVPVVVGVGAAGGLGRIFSFTGLQGSRGVQLESMSALPLLWARAAGNHAVHTVLVLGTTHAWEVHGPGAAAAGRFDNIALIVGVLAVLAALVGLRLAGLPADPVAGGLCGVGVLLLTDKVLSPQYLVWLGGFGCLWVMYGSARRWTTWVVAVGLLGVAGCTQYIYPWHYDQLIFNQTLVPLVVATVRAALLLAVTVAAAAEMWPSSPQTTKSRLP
jgi:hypothetical protein